MRDENDFAAMQMTRAAATSSAPCFLICTGRSGSNLIEQMPGAHPDVCVLSSVHHGQRLLQHLHYTLPRGSKSPPSGKESSAWRVLADRAARRTAWVRSEAEAQRLHAWMDAQHRVAAADFARFLYLELPQEAKDRLVFIKERGLQHLMFFLLETFPSAKFVFQVRDPRDVLLSAQRLRGGWLHNMFGSTRQMLACWDQDQRFGLAALGLLGRERVHLQRYEDLVGNPEDTLRALAAFLAIGWDDGMLAFHETPAAKRRSQQEPASHGNLDKPLLRENFGKWRRGLSAGQVKTVEAHLGDLMDRFGYLREHDMRHARIRSMHLLKALLLAPLEHAANRDLHLWRHERGFERDLRRLDREPLLPPLDYPAAP